MAYFVLLTRTPGPGPPVGGCGVAFRVGIVGLLLWGNYLDEGLADLLAGGLLDALEASVVEFPHRIRVADLEGLLWADDDRGGIVIQASPLRALAPRPLSASGFPPLAVGGNSGVVRVTAVGIVILVCLWSAPALDEVSTSPST